MHSIFNIIKQGNKLGQEWNPVVHQLCYLFMYSVRKNIIINLPSDLSIFPWMKDFYTKFCISQKPIRRCSSLVTCTLITDEYCQYSLYIYYIWRFIVGKVFNVSFWNICLTGICATGTVYYISFTFLCRKQP